MGGEGRRPAPRGRGRSGWAAARGCAGRRPVCGQVPQLGFAARMRCGPAVSGRRPSPRPLGLRQRPAGLLASLSPPTDCPGVPCLHRACRLQPAHLVAWRPLATATGPTGSLRNPSGIPADRVIAPIRHLPPADAGVCASRCVGGAPDSKTLPECSPRPACNSVFCNMFARELCRPQDPESYSRG